MTPLTKGRNRFIPRLAKMDTINCFRGSIEPEKMLIVSEGASPESTFLSFLSGSSSSSSLSPFALFLFELFNSENLPDKSNLNVSDWVDSPGVDALIVSLDVRPNMSSLSIRGVEGSDLNSLTRRTAASFSASLGCRVGSGLCGCHFFERGLGDES